MNIRVRSADLNQDKDLLVSTLLKHLSPQSDERRFEWLYLHNPHGKARAWLGIDDATGEAVGASAAFPRRMIVNGRERLGWVLGDFCVSSKYRSLGPALQLQKLTLSAVDAGEAEFCYDFPSVSMTAIYKRMGLSPEAQLVRFSKLLRMDRKIEAFIGRSKWSTAAVGALNSLLRLSRYRVRRRGNWSFDFLEGECGEEFTRVARSAERCSGAQVLRSAEYLNWRYLRHPHVSHRILSARSSGKLEGYLVFSCVEQNAQIVELCASSRELTSGLIYELSRRLIRTGIMSLDVFLISNDFRRDVLEREGFWPRESSPVIVYWPIRKKNSSTNDNGVEWLLMQGDRDS